MHPCWAFFFSAALPFLADCSGPDNCTVYKGTDHGVSLELKSLMCYNDYKSHIYCQWREDPGTQARTPLELWNWNSKHRRESLCEPSAAPFVLQDDDHTHSQPLMRQCRLNVSLFAIGINHMFFFKTAKATSCSSLGHRSLDLSQQLMPLPPVDLSARTSGDGAQLMQWSSPYPAASHLSQNLTFQLDYRPEGQDTWRKETLKETHLKLTLSPGCWYEARVRAMAPSPMSLWSEWSPLVVWKTPEASGQTPSMQCVLDGDESVTCSWELSRELAQFITYQLACRHTHTHSSIAPWCCPDPEITPVSRHKEMLVRYSCTLLTANPEQLTVELLPRRNVKSFQSQRHIRPNPPTNVTVAEKGGNWIVKWDKQDSIPTLSFQVRYWNNEVKQLRNVSEGSGYLFILGDSLGPSTKFDRVQVRALLPGGESSYAGTPSEWSKLAKWTPRAVGPTWSPEALLYVGLSTLVAVLCFFLFFIAQAGRRKAVAWLDSSPAPDKSKLFLENKSLSCSHDALLQKEKTDISRISHLDMFSSCSLPSDVLIFSSEAKVDINCWRWPESVSEDKGCCCNDLMLSAHNGDKYISTDISVVSFDGPYIFCKCAPEPAQVSAEADPREVSESHQDKPYSCSSYVTTPTTAATTPILTLPQPFALTASCSLRGDYVFLPNPGPSTSTVAPVVDHLEVEEDHNQTELLSNPGNPMYVSLQPGTSLW